MAELSRDEAQTTIYRGCARLAEAMQIERVAKDAAQRWEDGVLQEVVRDGAPRSVCMHNGVDVR